MDDPLLDAFGFPHPSAWLRLLAGAAIRRRSRLARLLPERRRPAGASTWTTSGSPPDTAGTSVPGRP
jgi:hypothetical protein